MKVLTKWASCAMAFLAGVLTLLVSLGSGMVTSVAGQKETTQAMKVLTDSKLADAAEMYGLADKFGAMKGFSVVLTIVAVLCVVYAVLMLLKNLNVLKVSDKVFSIVGIVLGVAFMAAAIGVFVASVGYANGVEDFVKKSYAAAGMPVKVSVKVGVFQPVMLVVGILTAAVIGVFEFLKLKNK